MGLKSDGHEVKTYADIALHVYGPWAQHVVNILQSVQLLFCVGVIILGNGQGLSQVVKGRVCFSVLCLLWALAGMLVGQIRTLQRFSWIANGAVWMNLLVVFTTMGISAHSTPNFGAALAQNSVMQGPVKHTIFAPESVDFAAQVVGLMQAVCSYSGAMLFCEMMADMKRPEDFWKSLLCAQVLIVCCYMTYGVFVYAQQGQFTINPANQGLSPYNWQTATNVVSMVAGLISAGLYGNIGIKILYHNVIKDLLNGPSLCERKGKLVWVLMVPLYWGLAFIVGSAIPQFSNISGLITAVSLLQTTYTFPPLLMLGFQMQRDAARPDASFSSASGQVDSWSNLSHWKRAFVRNWYFKIFNLLLFIGASVSAALGIYSSIKGIIAGFQGQTVATSFGCRSPVV